MEPSEEVELEDAVPEDVVLDDAPPEDAPPEADPPADALPDELGAPDVVGPPPDGTAVPEPCPAPPNEPRLEPEPEGAPPRLALPPSPPRLLRAWLDPFEGTDVTARAPTTTARRAAYESAGAT